MSQLEFSRLCPSSCQCRVGWGYPPGQVQNSCSISPEEEDSAQHFGVERGGSVSKKVMQLETYPSHLVSQGWNLRESLVLQSFSLKVAMVSLPVFLPDRCTTASGERN